jgi:RNA polymerase primary sigma factor
MPQTISRNVLTLRPFETYLHDINETALLNAEEEAELAERVRDGDAEARDHLARANLRLVVSVARQFAGKGVAIEDLIAEGNLGLLRSVEGFDPTQGVRFSTYASYWIKQSIRRCVMNTARSVRVPAHAEQLLVRWRRAAVELREELGREPTEQEVAAHLGVSARKLKIIQKALRIHAGTGQQSEEGDGLLPSLPCGGDSPEARLGGEEEARQVLELVSRLPQREAAVLRLRFGLDGGEPMTLKAIGERLGLTRERVRQVEVEALRSLRERLEAA